MDSVVKDMNVILVIAPIDYQHVEYSVTKKALETAGVKVTTASTLPGGAIAKDKVTTTPIDLTLDAITLHEYDGIFIIGGGGAMVHLDTPAMYHLINQAKKLHIPYGAICISVRILAKAGALKGLQATGWNEDKALDGILQGYGAIYKPTKDVIVDGMAVTATNPKAALGFGQGILQLLHEKKLSKKL